MASRVWLQSSRWIPIVFAHRSRVHLSVIATRRASSAAVRSSSKLFGKQMPPSSKDGKRTPVFFANGIKASADGSVTKVAFEPETLPMVTVDAAAVLSWKGDLLVLGVFEEALKTSDDSTEIVDEKLKSINDSLGGVVSDIIAMVDFKAKTGSTGTLRAGGDAKFVQLVGLGKADKATPVVEWGISPFQTLGSQISAAAKTHKAKTAGVAIIGGPAFTSDQQEGVVGKIALGIHLGGYEATRFKTNPTQRTLESLAYLEGTVENVAPVLAASEAFARGCLTARYLVEAPPNVATPTHLAECAATIASSAPDVMALEVLEQQAVEELNMGCYLGVAYGSREPLKFIHLTYKPVGEVKKVLGICGKGVTFDSGGYNIKAGPGSMIELMKFDMGGAAAALGAAKIISATKPAGVEVHFIVPACENMVDGAAFRPGDVLTSAKGKTVEIINTDAEGRLTLADALWFAEKRCGCEVVVDVATLTGAMIVSLGTGMAGLFTPSDALSERLLNASKTSGEKMWRMPLEDSYAEQMKSQIADIKNLGGRWGGAITAALFLKEFVSTDKVEWAHLDIAGPAWDDKNSVATGYGAQLLAHFISSYAG